MNEQDRIILTGDRPTGPLHIGHYVGSLRNRVLLQNEGAYKRMFVFIADAQALTDNFENPEKVRQNIIEVALDYFSAGLDPDKVTIYIQSQIPELAELTFYYMNLVTVARLQRNPTVKAEIAMRGFSKEEGDEQTFGSGLPVGFFTYPISQAADITAFKATTVPTGADQKPMIEQAVEIVRAFNRIYGGNVLVEPEILLPDKAACMRLPGIDGKSKMSKSLGNCIYLSESADEMRKKVMSMYTDPLHINVSDPGHIEGNAVFTYLDAFCRTEHFGRYWPDFSNLDELKAGYERGGIGDVKVKKFLEKILNEELEPIRARRKEYEKDIPAVYDLLKKGSVAAREVAAATMDDVKKAMKIDYFEDRELIEEQARRFSE
jgi:tryptophanyl-tRNA synthetase